MTALEAALGAFELPPITRLERIPTGTINTNYAVEAGGSRYFLRLNREKPEAEVAYEAELLTHLAARGVATPRPRLTREGRPYAHADGGLVLLFPWVDGDHRQGPALVASEVHALGASLAALHLAGRDFGRRAASRYAFDRIVERYQGLEADCCDPALMAAIGDVGDEITWLTERRQARDALPAGVIHGDLFPDNVLFQGEALAALLDFEQASDGAFAYDLAVCLCAWCFDDAFVPARARALVAGYQAVRPLGADERRLFAVEARAAAMRFTVTRITDVYLSATATPEVRRTKDFRRFHARMRRLRQMGEGTFEELVGLG